MNAKEKNKFRTTKTWKEFRAKLIAERGNTCEICGIKKRSGLNLHHHEEANYTDLNPMKFSLLCRGCHKELEKLLRRKSFSIDTYCENMKRVFIQSK